MKFLRYFILVLIVWGIPTFAWTNYGERVGNVFSTMLTGTLLIYYASNKKSMPPITFILLGLTYYLISGLQYQGETSFFLNDAIKYFIFIICGYEIARRTNKKELFILLVIGALSILIDAIFFPSSWGRYAGFFINPNGAGFICVLGFALSFTFDDRKTNLIGQGVFVMCGLLTFSRYVILLFAIIYIMAIILKRRNLVGLVFGTLGLILLVSFTNLRLNTVRFNAFKSIFSDKVDTQALGEESRDETWALYNKMIIENPVIGSGFKSMQGYKPESHELKVGVHNTYLMVIGEAGFIPFVIILLIYTRLFIKSISSFYTNSELMFMATIMLTFLLVMHNYFDNHIVLFASIWLYHQLHFKQKINPVT